MVIVNSPATKPMRIMAIPGIYLFTASSFLETDFWCLFSGILSVSYFVL